MRIVFDPGHGGRDPGATAGGVMESDLALKISQRATLFAISRGHFAFLTRHADYALAETKGLDLAARVELSRLVEADVFISIHCNAAENKSAHGYEMWTSPGQTESDKIATEIYDRLEKTFPELTFRYDFSDGDKDKEARFYVLTRTSCPAVLCEMGFITNPHDRAKLLQPGFRDLLAQQLVLALEEWDGKRQARCSL